RARGDRARRRLLVLLPRQPGPPGRRRRRARRLESARGRRPARGDAPALPRRRLSRGACAAPRRQRGGARGGARVRRRWRRDLPRVRRATIPRRAAAAARAGGALTSGRAPAKGIGMRARLAIVLAAAALGGCAPAPAPSPAGAPARIVSLAPSITEIVYALGAGERLVGVCAQCDYPAAVASVPRVGGYLVPSVEVTLAARPDLVIAVPSPGNREAVRAIERAGVRVLVVHDRTLAELWDS